MKITYKQSPNYTSGRKGYKPEIIVCHITEGSYAGAVSWLCNKASQASAHFVVSKKGEVTQLVNLRDYAWCNGTSTTKTKNNYYGKSTNSIVQKKKTNANYFSVSIELEGTTATTGGKLTDAQYDALVALILHIQKEVKKIWGHTIPLDRNHIIGHNEVSPITKPYCPGVNFPWTALITSLTNRTVALSSKNSTLRVDSTPVVVTDKNGVTDRRDVYRILYQDTNYMKLRDICDIAGAEVNYTTRPSVTVSVAPNVEVDLVNDKNVNHLVIDVITNGIPKQMTVNSILMDGTNYVRMRDVCLLLGVDLGYNSALRLPTIKLK